MQARIPAKVLGRKVPARLTGAFALALMAGLLGAACGGEKPKDPKGLVSSHGATGGTSGSGAQGSGAQGGADASGGSTTIVVAGGSAGTSSTGEGGSGASDSCASDSYDGKLVPLDLYVMLDSSGSMTEMTGSTTKWDAVGSALRAFTNDSASSGIGISLQFFPLPDPAVPDLCHADADCGTFGPCFENYCKTAGPDFAPCSRSSDCVQDGEDFGPCAPLTFCWSKLTDANPNPTLCHDDAECGKANDCIPFAHCATNEYLLCDAPGKDCANNAGRCTAAPPASSCLNWGTCQTSFYATPAVEIATLPGAAAAITSAIAAQMPSGNTPSSPALTGAIDHAHTWALAHPDHQVAVVLATDGLPSECIADANGDPTGITGVTTAAAAGVAGTPSISTFVIGVFSSDDTQSPQNLDQIAKAGGSNKAFVANADAQSTPDETETQFLNALDAIRGARLPCDFQIPTPSAGTAIAYDEINVVFTTGGAAKTLYYSSGAAGCDASTGGWYYDVDPSAGTPHSIIACPASCTALQGSTDGHVSIQVGCRTLVR